MLFLKSTNFTGENIFHFAHHLASSCTIVKRKQLVEIRLLVLHFHFISLNGGADAFSFLINRQETRGGSESVQCKPGLKLSGGFRQTQPLRQVTRRQNFSFNQFCRSISNKVNALKARAQNDINSANIRNFQ